MILEPAPLRGLALLAPLALATGCPPPTETTPPAECLELTEPVEVSGAIDVDTDWLCPNVPYVVTADVFVGGGATLTVGPNVSVQMSGGTAIVVGSDAAGGGIVADGTDGPIEFTSTEAVPSPGDWEGIVVDGNALIATFHNVTVEYGGDFTPDGSEGGNGNLVVIGTADVTETTVTHSAGWGIDFAPSGRAGAFGDNVFGDNTAEAVRVYGPHLATLDSVNTFGTGDLVRVDGGTVDASGTWSAIGAPYRVIDDLDIEGTSTPVITIDPGAEFRFDSGATLIVGSGAAGGLVAEGTAAAPIVFTSMQGVPEAGDWEGVIVDGNTTAASFDFVEVRYAGDFSPDASAGVNGGLAIISGASASITNSTFADNETDGVVFQDGGSASAFGDNTFSGNTAFALRIDANQLGTLAGPNTVGAGETMRVTGGVVDTTATWSAIGAPYVVGGDVLIEDASAPVVTIEAGVELRHESGVTLVVGKDADGGLVADADGADAIVFTSAEGVPAAGDWEGIVLDGNTTVATFRNVTVSYAGDFAPDASVGGSAGLRAIQTDVTIEDCTFTDHESAAVWFDSTARALSFSGNTFTSNDRPISVLADAVASLGAPNTFDAADRVEVRSDTVIESGTWSDLGAPYRVIGDVRVEGSADPVLTIAAGVEVQLSSGATVVVGDADDGGLIADGTSGRITFTSDEGVPAAGDWEAVVFDGNTLAGAVLRDVDLSFCGDFTPDASDGVRGCVGVIDSSPTISGCSFADSSTNGIDLVGSASPTLTGNTFSGIALENVD